MYKGNRLVLILALSILLNACASNSYFKEPPSSAPHAVLKFEASRGVMSAIFGGVVVAPLEINGRPPNEWKWSFEEFLIPPGNTVVLTRALISPKVVASAFVKFFAKPMETYYISHTSGIEYAIIKVSNSQGRVLTAVKAKKQAYNHKMTAVPIIIPVR